MALKEYIPKRETIEFPGGSFEVRGISLPDVSLLIDVHEHVISDIAEKVRNRAELIGSDNPVLVQEAMTDLISEMIREAPSLVGNLIAICAEEEDAYSQAMKLPITVQLDALTKIANLTFTDMASIKKLVADVMRLVRRIVPTANARRKK